MALRGSESGPCIELQLLALTLSFNFELQRQRRKSVADGLCFSARRKKTKERTVVTIPNPKKTGPAWVKAPKKKKTRRRRIRRSKPFIDDAPAAGEVSR